MSIFMHKYIKNLDIFHKKSMASYTCDYRDILVTLCFFNSLDA